MAAVFFFHSHSHFLTLVESTVPTRMTRLIHLTSEYHIFQTFFTITEQLLEVNSNRMLPLRSFEC